jgi:hypothetical protein
MESLKEIRTRIDADHPVLTKQVSGVKEPLAESKRAATLDEWAQASFDQQVEAAFIADGGTSPNYAQYRADAYPSIGDQLDMQYHDAVDSTTTWRSAIAAVKTKYPKP